MWGVQIIATECHDYISQICRDQKLQFYHCQKFSIYVCPHLFLSSLLTQKCPFGALGPNSESMFLTFFNTLFWPKAALFYPEGLVLTQKRSITSCYKPKQCIRFSESVFSKSVFSQSLFSQSVFSQSVFSQNVFPQSVLF